LSKISPGYTELDAAVALSHIKDPVAIPFLQQMLESGTTVDRYAAEGLGRIGTMGQQDAIDVLIASLAKANVDRRSYITSALRNAEKTTSDEKIKFRIKAALSR
jgi:HEAT repeat protein